MITYVQGPREKLTTVHISADMTQGQWGYMNGENADGDAQVTPVTSYALAQKAVSLLGPVYKTPISQELGDSSYETIYVNDGDANDDGKFPVFAFGEGHMLEDDMLTSRVSADFDSADYGASMVLTVSGYPTLDGATDDPGSSATVVALFVNKLGDSITYITI